MTPFNSLITSEEKVSTLNVSSDFDIVVIMCCKILSTIPPRLSPGRSIICGLKISEIFRFRRQLIFPPPRKSLS